MGPYPISMVLEVLPVRIPGVESHGPGQLETGKRLRWQGMGLLVVHFLKPVFGVPEKTIGGGEFTANRLWYKALFAQYLQYRLDGRLLECRQDTTPDQLEHLAEKLDFPDAAASQLDVVVQFFPTDLGGDFLLHLPQRLEHAEIQIPAIDEGSKSSEKSLAGIPVTGHHVGLDQRIALPFTSLELVVVLHVIKIHDQWAAVAVGSKPCVHPKDKSVGGVFTDGLDQVSAKPVKKGFIGQGPPAAPGFAFGREGENQVHIRGKIEFAGTQLSHADHHQPLNVSAGILGCAVDHAHAVKQQGQGAIHCRSCQGGKVCHGVVKIADPGHIPDGDAHHLPPPEGPKGCLERCQQDVRGGIRIGLRHRLKHRRQAVGHATVIVSGKQIAAADQIQCHAGMANTVGGNEVTEAKGGCQGLCTGRGEGHGRPDGPGFIAKGGPAFLLMVVQDLGRGACDHCVYIL